MDKIPMPPLPQRNLYLPLPFWLDIITNLDKRSEILSHDSGYGIISIDIKFHKGKVYEVEIEEKTRIRDAIEKANSTERQVSSQQGK